jgi:hypothetical protein
MILRITKGAYSPSDILWRIGVAPLMAQLEGYARTFQQAKQPQGRRRRDSAPSDPEEWFDM